MTEWKPARALVVIGAIVIAAAPAAASAADDLAELERLAAEVGVDLDLPTWETGGTVEVGAGTNDNVLLSALAPDGSAFVRTDLEALALRLPRDGREWNNYFDATYSRYFSAAPDDALLALARSEFRWRPGGNLRFAIGGQWLYQNEVIDASTLESGLISAKARVSVVSLEPSVRWTFLPHWTAALQLSAGADDYRPPFDDFDEYDGELVLERDLGRGGLLSAAVGRLQRDYRERFTATVSGREETEFGIGLEVAQTRAELRYELRGGRELAWRVKAKSSYLDNDDNGSGWYDYFRRVSQINGSLEGDGWRLEGEAGWRRYNYRVQTVGEGNPPKRRREAWTWYARFERDLRENLAAFIEIDAEHSISNDPFLTYNNTTSVIGLQWKH